MILLSQESKLTKLAEQAYQSEMLPTTLPEIQRQNLESVILTLKSMGISDLIGFQFLDPPPVSSMLEAMQSLYSLSLLGTFFLNTCWLRFPPCTLCNGFGQAKILSYRTANHLQLPKLIELSLFRLLLRRKQILKV